MNPISKMNHKHFLETFALEKLHRFMDLLRKKIAYMIRGLF